MPAGTGEQLPSADGSAQLRQLPPHAVLQQMPSMQKPLAHSPPVMQAWPFGLGPQLPFWQDWPATQSASLLQWSMHALPEQRYGVQACARGIRQLPRPSQVPAAVRVSPLQDGTEQTVSIL
jgi:hypothetical protein